MRVLFWQHTKRTEKLDALERQASLVHQQNISKIAAAQEKADTLNIALKQNNIVFQLAHVIGHAK